MEYGKTIIFLMIAIFLFSIASVSASDVNDTVIAFEDTSQNELSDCNEIVTDNLKASEENNILEQTDSDNAVSAESDSEILGESEGNYTDLRNDIANGGSLTKSIYYYHDGDGETIGITTNFMVIDGNGAVIDMSGSNKRAFYVSASHVTIKNLTIKNANYGGDGGAIYFGAYGTVLNCNFANNTASRGGAVYLSIGTVSNCKFTNNKVFGSPNWGGAICMGEGRVENCYFADNSASQGGAILSVQYLGVTVDTCIFKTGSDTTYNTRNLPPVLNVDNFTTVYGSGEKITFDLKTNSGVPVSDGNISISVYFKDNNDWVGNYSCLSGEGWIPNLPVGSYYVIYDTEYSEFNAINRTITITLPAGKYYVNVTSLITGNKTVNITAKTDVPKDIIWDAKLLFILPNGSEINAIYGGNGTWWAVHTFDDYDVYQISASYVGLDNVTVNNGTIEVPVPGHTFSFLNYLINGNDNSVIELSDDFYFNPEYDAAFVDGIVINRPVTINGNGHTIDAKGQARIFNVQSENTVIENLTIQNAKRDDGGGAIYFNSYGTVTNCNFTNNSARNGGAVYFSNQGTVSNCNFINNKATGYNSWGGAICMNSGRVENCYFVNNSASKGGAILGVQYLTVTVDTCIFKTGSDTTYNTRNLPPVLNVDNFTTVYGSGEKITFDLKTNSGVAVSDGNISISVYFKDTNDWVGNYSCLSGEGGIPDLPVGSYYVIYDTEYSEFNAINRTITITLPAGKYYVNVTSLTTGNKTVNITAKTNVPKDMIWDAKLVFILPNGSEINPSYGGNDTWWAVHTFDDCSVYQISASYVGVDNVTVRNGTVTINKADSTITLENITLDYGNLTNLTVTTAGATGITAKIDGNDIDVINNFIIQIPVLNAGNHTLTVTTVPDDDHNPATKTVNITVNKVDSILTVSGIAFDYGGSGSIVVSFTGADGVNAKVVGQGDEVVKVNGTNIIVSGLNSGFYNLTVTTIADANHNNVTKNVTVTVNKVDASLTVSEVVLDYGETKNITVMAEGVVGIVACIGESEVKVDGFVISIPALDAGTYTLTVTAIADMNHNNVTKNVTVTVNKVDATLTVDDVVLDYGETKNITVMGEGVVGIVAVIGESEVKVDGFVISIPALDAGTYILSVTAIADMNHNNVTKNVTVTVNKVDATLTVDDVVLDYGETKNITVMGEGVVGIVACIGESEVKVDGFVISIPVLDAGTYTLTVTTIADANHNNVTKNVTVTVNKVNATLTVDDVALDYGETKDVAVMGEGVVGIVAWIGESEVKVDGFVISIPALDAGTYTLTVTTIADANHNNVTKNVTVTVNKVNATLTVDDVALDYGETKDVAVVGEGVVGIVAWIGESEVKVDGFVISIPVLDAGTHTLTVTAIADANHNPVTKEASIRVLKVDSTLSFEKINFDELSIVIAANGASGVTAKIDGVDIVVVDNYTIVIPSLAAGDHILSVTTIPDVSHNPVTRNLTVVVNKLQTELSGNDVIATYNVNTDLVITLKDSAGKALSGVKVTVDLNGAKTYTTDKNGQVKVPTKGLAPKTYTAKITFNGDANHDKSVKNIKVTVKKATPKMTAKKKTFKAKTKTKKYAITLKDNTGKAMKKVKVTLKIKGKKTITVKTNSKGKATFKIKKLTKKGTYKSTVTYKGNKYYNKVTKKVKIKVK